VGNKLVPWTTIRDRMEKKDLRFESEARRIAAKRNDVQTDAARASASLAEAQRIQALRAARDLTIVDTPGVMTHEQRQRLIRLPITFHYYGGMATGGTGVQDTQTHTRVRTYGAWGVRPDDPND
jgi:hypothetical protein